MSICLPWGRALLSGHLWRLRLSQTALLAVGVVAGCTAPGGTPLGRSKMDARFGVLFGGQIQRRTQLPLVIDPGKQIQALRIVADPPPTRGLRIDWEWGRGPTGGWVRDSRGRRYRKRRVEVGFAHWKPGEPVFEKVLAFQPEDRPGIWNIRVSVDGRVLLDRPLEVYDPSNPPLGAAAQGI